MKIAFRCSLTRPALERFVPLVLLLAAMNCGGGGSSSGSGRGSSQSPNFSLTVSPTSQTIAAGNQASISLAATPAGSFTSKVGVQITGLPAGVSLSPTTITLTPGTPQQVTLSAATNAATTTHEITFSGSSGSLTHTAQLSLSVKGLSPPPAGRTKYLRSDGATEYYSWLNSHWIIFNAPTSRFFSADPGSNHVFVFDSVSETEIGALIVPGAYAIGDSPDHTTLYVGTLIGDVYTMIR